MRIPKVPSVLHFARFASKDTKQIDAHLRQMAERPPRINYNPTKSGARDKLVLGVSDGQTLAALDRIKGVRQRDVNIGALSAFLQVAPVLGGRNYSEVGVHYYPIGRRLFVPVNPFMYTAGRGVQSLLWPSFWKNLVLKEHQLAVYATIMDLSFFNSLDYEGCALEFIDLGCRPGETTRTPCILSRSQLPTMTTKELQDYTDPFAEVFLRLVAEIRGASEAPGRSEHRDAPVDWHLDQAPPK